METKDIDRVDSTEAAAALAGISGAERRLAEQFGPCSPWRHAAFGLVMALLVGGISLPLVLNAASMVAAMALAALLVHYDRRRCGVFINGYRQGKTLPLTLLLLGGLVLLLFAQAHAREAGLSAWARAGIAGLAFVYAVAGSVVWQRVFLAELRTRCR